MGHEQVVPAVAEDDDRRFRVDRDVGRRALRIPSQAALRVELDEPDVAEVRAVGEPQRSVRRIAEDAGIDRVAVLDAVGPDHGAGIRPAVVGRLRVERLAHEQPDGGFRLRARRRVIEEVFVADFHHVRRPGVVAAARDDLGRRLSAGHRCHQAAGPPPGPPVVGHGHRQSGPRGVDVIPRAVADDRRGIVQADVAVERQDAGDEQQRGGRGECRLHASSSSV